MKTELEYLIGGIMVVCSSALLLPNKIACLCQTKDRETITPQRRGSRQTKEIPFNESSYPVVILLYVESGEQLPLVFYYLLEAAVMSYPCLNSSLFLHTLGYFFPFS